MADAGKKQVDRKTIADDTLDFLIQVRDSETDTINNRLKAAETLMKVCANEITVNMNYNEQLLAVIRAEEGELLEEIDDATTRAALEALTK